MFFPLTDFYLSRNFSSTVHAIVAPPDVTLSLTWFSFVHFDLLLIVWLTANTLGKKYMRELSRRSRIGGKIAHEYLLACETILLVDITKIN